MISGHFTHRIYSIYTKPKDLTRSRFGWHHKKLWHQYRKLVLNLWFCLTNSETELHGSCLQRQSTQWTKGKGCFLLEINTELEDNDSSYCTYTGDGCAFSLVVRHSGPGPKLTLPMVAWNVIHQQCSVLLQKPLLSLRFPKPPRDPAQSKSLVLAMAASSWILLMHWKLINRFWDCWDSPDIFSCWSLWWD